MADGGAELRAGAERFDALLAPRAWLRPEPRREKRSRRKTPASHTIISSRWRSKRTLRPFSYASAAMQTATAWEKPA